MFRRGCYTLLNFMACTFPPEFPGKLCISQPRLLRVILPPSAVGVFHSSEKHVQTQQGNRHVTLVWMGSQRATLRGQCSGYLSPASRESGWGGVSDSSASYGTRTTSLGMASVAALLGTEEMCQHFDGLFDGRRPITFIKDSPNRKSAPHLPDTIKGSDLFATSNSLSLLSAFQHSRKKRRKSIPQN